MKIRNVLPADALQELMQQLSIDHARSVLKEQQLKEEAAQKAVDAQECAQRMILAGHESALREQQHKEEAAKLMLEREKMQNEWFKKLREHWELTELKLPKAPKGDAS